MPQLTIIVDIPLHQVRSNESKDTFRVSFQTNAQTVDSLYKFLETLGYTYPKYKLHMGEAVLEPGSMVYLSDLNAPNNTLYLKDPFFGGLLVGTLLGGAAGYAVGKSSSK
jgi:hypothetical protein